MNANFQNMNPESKVCFYSSVKLGLIGIVLSIRNHFFIYLFIHLFIYLFITHILVRRPGIGTVYSCKLRSLWCWSNVGTTFMYRRWINYVGPILERWQCTNSDIYNVGLMLVQCRSTNSDNVQTLCQHWVSLSLLSGVLH